MRSATLFVIALIFSLSPAFGQNKKEDTKDVTADVRKLISGTKLQLGAKLNDRYVAIDKGMVVKRATQTKNSIVIEIVVVKNANATFVQLDGLVTAVYDPKKGKNDVVSTSGTKHFKNPGTLILSVSNLQALAAPPANNPAPPSTPGDRKSVV